MEQRQKAILQMSHNFYCIFSCRWLGFNIWRSYKVWSRLLLYTVWYSVHCTTLLPV